MKFHLLLLLLTAMTILAGRPRAFSEETAILPESWEKDARKSGLSEADISQLKKNRILITNATYKQIFSVYLSREKPRLITSDSLLNAYHVLYEESILHLEDVRALQMPEILKFILSHLQDTAGPMHGRPELVSAAKRRAALVVGIAMRLMDDSFRFGTGELDKILDQETKNIVDAQGVQKPKWLNSDKTFPAVDYGRYQPRGFYASSDRLQRYFRAVSWLQSIPFRVDKDEELLAMAMLGDTATYRRFKDFEKRQKFELFFRGYGNFIGAGDDWDLMTAAQGVSSEFNMDLTNDDLQKMRDRFKELTKRSAPRPQINDQIRDVPEDPQEIAEPNFRIMSAYRTPSAVLFQQTTDSRLFHRDYPSGLEVAAVLGSKFAGDQLDAAEREKLLKTIDECRKYFNGNSLYFRYLNVLRALIDQAEPDAPDFMRTDAWQRKSCNTVLAGWAQLSHTWALQAKGSITSADGLKMPEGFVEPEPEFFNRMADLAEHAQWLFRESGAFTSAKYSSMIPALEKLAQILKEVQSEEQFDERASFLVIAEWMSPRMLSALVDSKPSKAKRGSKEYFKEKREWIETIIADLQSGKFGKHPQLDAILRTNEFDLEKIWSRFIEVSYKLEAIAHKELRGVDLNDRENNFIRNYGSTLGGIMLYGGDSYITPKDDSPRVADVFTNTFKRGHLHVGVARPRKLYVLYPWRGEVVLCKGAIMPYYEFIDVTRLTDEQWKARLDSDKRPAVPDWMTPIISGGNLSKPLLEREY